MQIRLLIKSLMTALETTQEGLFARVYPQMRFQVEVKRELLSTELTLVRFLTLI